MNTQTSDGWNFHVEIRGAGTPLLLVHGFPLNNTMWNAQLDGLVDCCRVIAPDLRGFGGSGVAVTDRLTMEQHADDLNELLDALGIHEPVVLCGLSMGGYVAFPFVRKYAHRLKGLILCDTRSAPDSPEGAQGRRQLAAKVLRSGPTPALEVMLPKLVSEKTNAEHPEVLDQLREMIVQTDRKTIAAALLGMAERADSTPLLRDIAVPTLVLCGEEDALTPAVEMQTIAAAIPDACYVEIPAAGHMAPMESPETVNTAIREYISGLN